MPYRSTTRPAAERETTRLPARRPLPVIAVVGPALALLFGLALLLAGPGYQWGWWEYRTGFVILRWSAIGGLVAALASLLGAAATRPGSGRRGFGLALLGLVVGSAVAAVPWWLRHSAQGTPAIHDITTDVENPPRFAAVLPRRAGAPNPADYGGPEVAAQQREAYPDIRPLELNVPAARAFALARAAAGELGWEIVAADSASGRIEATDRTFWFGFLDDIVVRITPRGNGSRIDVRSVSRVGKGDAGTNARRVRRFLERVRQAVGQ
ncbi:MAG: DUF1499 domain-containing protein [Chloroflexota bacterium]|nr:DUF1499 domain-containing protein [Chloroflexota bacterium]